MIIDGKALAKEVEGALASTVKGLTSPPTLAIICVGENPVTARFVRAKTTLAERIGITVINHTFSESVSTADICEKISALSKDAQVTGIVVQLPLPISVDVDKVLSCIPVEKDVDVLSPNALGLFRQEKLPILPPVAAAIQTILESQHVDVGGMDALVIGRGRLVGNPVALWLRHNDAHVTQIEKGVRDVAILTREADVIVSGAGVPSLITKDMVKDGVILLDAGTSDEGGVLKGDIDPSCRDKARLYTPVPSGIGPLTTVMLLKNLLILGREKGKPVILKG